MAERSAQGHFAKGNQIGKGRGNPGAARVYEFRRAILLSTSVKDMLACWAALMVQAKEGNIQAIREVFDRTIGKPVEADLMERIDILEQHIESQLQVRFNGSVRTIDQARTVN